MVGRTDDALSLAEARRDTNRLWLVDLVWLGRHIFVVHSGRPVQRKCATPFHLI